MKIPLSLTSPEPRTGRIFRQPELTLNSDFARDSIVRSLVLAGYPASGTTVILQHTMWIRTDHISLPGFYTLYLALAELPLMMTKHASTRN